MSLAEVLDPREGDETTVAIYTATEEITRAELRAQAEALAAVHRAKWLDWSETLDLTVRFRPLTPSSLFEWLRTSQIGASRRGRQVLALAGPLLDCWRFVDAAAASLRRAVACSPQLSSDAALSRCQNRMLERLEELRRDPFRVE